MFLEMRFDLGTLDSGERSLPFGLLVLSKRDSIKMHFVSNHLHGHGHHFSGVLKYYCCNAKFWGEKKIKNHFFFGKSSLTQFSSQF